MSLSSFDGKIQNSQFMKCVLKSFLKTCGLEIRRIQVSKRINIPPRTTGSERTSDEYDNIWKATGFVEQYIQDTKWFYEQLIKFAESCQLFQGIRYIADVGCGPGYLLKMISERHESVQLVGFDFSDDLLPIARQYCSSGKFRQHDIYSNMEDNFDLIICTEVLEHLLYPHRALGNILAKAPRILITIPDGCNDTYRGHINFWSIESWCVFLEQWRADWDFDPEYLTGTNSIVTVFTRKTL